MVKGTHCRTESWGVITTQRLQGSIGKGFQNPERLALTGRKGCPAGAVTFGWVTQKWDPVEREPNATESGQRKLPRSRKTSFQGAEKVKEGGKTSAGEKTHPRFCSVWDTHPLTTRPTHTARGEEVPSLPLSASFNCCPGRQDDGSHGDDLSLCGGDRQNLMQIQLRGRALDHLLHYQVMWGK